MTLRLFCRSLPLAACLLMAHPATAAEDDAARHCRLFQHIRAETAGGIGRLIDPVTRLAAVELQCADQLIHFNQQLVVPRAALKADWLARQRAQWSAAYCRPGSASAAAIRAGWTVTTTITTSDGARFSVTAACHEAMAARRAGDRV